jgi:probable HAF family extracellular repeat protein
MSSREPPLLSGNRTGVGVKLQPIRGVAEGGSRMSALRKAVIGTLLTMIFACAAAAQTYTVTDLGALSGFTSSYADDNNNPGLVTGCSDNSMVPTVPCTTNIASEAFLWSSSGGMQPLGYLSGNDMSIGYVVNDSRQVVGFSGYSSNGNGHGFSWTQSGGMSDLGTLPGGNAYSVAAAITSKGVIAGESLKTGGDVDVVLWTLSGGTYQIQDEGHLPKAPYCYAYDINEKLQVIGVAYFNYSGTRYHGFLWSKAKGWKDLPPLPGGKLSEGIWMTDAGVIAGVSTSAKYPNGVSVYWDTKGKITPIGTLPGGDRSSPGYISDSLEILGDSTVSGGGDHAYIWTQKKRMRDLNNMIPKNSGWDLHRASSINKSGQIVGYGTINGEDHGFLLKP